MIVCASDHDWQGLLLLLGNARCAGFICCAQGRSMARPNLSPPMAGSVCSAAVMQLKSRRA